MSWPASRIWAGAAAAAVSLWSASASAFCFAAVCPEGTSGTICGPPQPLDCPTGRALRWEGGCTGFSLQRDASVQVDYALASAITQTAFAAWTQADCGGLLPSIHVENMGRVRCDKVEYNKAAGNANVVVFRDASWPHPNDSHSVALTTTTFDPDSGALLDADIEVNTSGFALTTTETTASFDLQSVLTHEAGHFLDIGHSDLPESTMFAVYQPGQVEPRTLHPDDVAAICNLYPAGNQDPDCNPLQRHGFSPDCAGEQREIECAVGGAPAPRLSFFALCALFVLGIARRCRGERALKSRRACRRR